KDQFISTVTHELRTPLTAVHAIAEIIHDNPSLGADKRIEFVRIIIKESERLNRLINQVLDFQVLEAGQTKWHMTEVDLTAVVRHAVTVVNNLDQDRLVQVMINLLANAIKFCPPDSGRIDIALAMQPAALQIDVKDNGPGIDISDQEVVFERFKQVAVKGQGRPSGSGLGLSISKHIIEYHGGRIWIDSRLNEGTTFSFTLPSESSPAA
ncbi:MAG: histidine kinase, partial [Desulfobacterales bacterium]